MAGENRSSCDNQQQWVTIDEEIKAVSGYLISPTSERQKWLIRTQTQTGRLTKPTSISTAAVSGEKPQCYATSESACSAYILPCTVKIDSCHVLYSRTLWLLLTELQSTVLSYSVSLRRYRKKMMERGEMCPHHQI